MVTQISPLAASAMRGRPEAAEAPSNAAPNTRNVRRFDSGNLATAFMLSPGSEARAGASLKLR